MKSLVVFDSQYGNTERIARAIAESLGGEALHVHAATEDRLEGLDLLVAGSPTQGGRPTAGLKDWVDALPAATLQGLHVAAFDTRFEPSDHGFAIRVLLRAVGNAGPRIAADLRGRGAVPVAPAEGFIVIDREGPLKDGEVERARRWGAELILGVRAAA